MNPPVGSEPSKCCTSADVAALKRYQYHPIDKSDIRRVRIDSSAGYLQGYLSTHDRLKGGFIALSYEWGSSAPTFHHAIWIADEHGGEGFLPMTENLSNAVKDLQQSPVQSKSFFIDQLCMNQQDNKEKSIQVAGMSNVYKHADQVVCYLGPSVDLDFEALQLLQRLNAHSGEWFEALDSTEFERAQYDAYQGRLRAHFDSFRLSASEMLLLGRLEKVIFDSGWTERLWMCQEVILNKELNFLRGSRLIAGCSVFLLSLYYTALRGELESISPLSFSFLEGNLVGSAYKAIHTDVGDESLLASLTRFSTHRKCSDPRDKVYGVLGLAKDNLGIVPNYEADVADVYTDFAWRCIERSRNLEIFRHILQQDDSLQDPDIPTTRKRWPTWVPRFEKPFSFIKRGYTTGSTISRAKINPSKRMLKIEGWPVEQIETLCGQLNIRSPAYGVDPLTLGSIRQFMETIEAAREALAVKGVQEAESKLCFGLMNGLYDLVTLTAKDGFTPNFATDRALQSLMRVMRLALDASLTSQNGTDEITLDYDQDRDGSLARQFHNRMEIAQHVLCITTTGEIILAAPAVRPGDIITILPGGDSVYVLRALGNDEFVFVGPAFAQGYTMGAAIRDLEWEGRLSRLIQRLLETSSRTDVDGSYDSNISSLDVPDLEYCIGCILSRPQARQILNQEDGVKKIRSEAMKFLHIAPHDQVRTIDRALIMGPEIGADEDMRWRRKWWNMIDQWIEAGMIPAPKWMENLGTFTIR